MLDSLDEVKRMTMHEGHRKRMRERYRKEGLEGFADHEALELLLFYGRARGDVNPLAHTLMDTFGSLQGVLEATPDQLLAVHGVGEETATLISLMLPMFRRYTACLCRERKRLTTRTEAKQYCQSLLAGWRSEKLYVIGLDAEHQLLGHRLVAEGSTGGVQMQPRLVVEAAMNLNARAVILCHNHPGGTDWPSVQDLNATEHINLLLKGMEIELLDHVIVAGEKTYSMDENGDLTRDPGRLIAADVQAADSGGQVLRKRRGCSGVKRKEST